jgi:DNA-binding NarL/FixJ family response regulator
MAVGCSTEQIGERLVITRATAKRHIRSTLRKLGAKPLPGHRRLSPGR